MMTVIFTTLLMLGTASVATTDTGDGMSPNDPPAVVGEEEAYQATNEAALFDGGVEPVCLACR